MIENSSKLTFSNLLTFLPEVGEKEKDPTLTVGNETYRLLTGYRHRSGTL